MSLKPIKYNKPTRSISAENDQFSIVASGGSRLAGAPPSINIFHQPTKEKIYGWKVASYKPSDLSIADLLADFTANHNKNPETAQAETAQRNGLSIFKRESVNPIITRKIS